MRGRGARGVVAAAALALAGAAGGGGCATVEPHVMPPGVGAPYEKSGYVSERYKDARWWVCRPEQEGAACSRDRTAVEIRGDGSRVKVAPVAASEPAADCFYVYPTVDLSLLADNHTDFSDTTPMEDVAFAQAAAFSEVCKVYAPLYRQITIGAYLRSLESRERRLAVAFSDVEDAFIHYLANDNRGRPVVLLGHSQGAEMVVRLVNRFFEGGSELRPRLVAALAIGGHVEVKKGALTGGTFASVPLCSGEADRGCVIAYRSHRGGAPVDPIEGDLPAAGNEIACVNPADIPGNALRPLAGTLAPLTPRLRDSLGDSILLRDADSPMVLLRGFFSAQCTAGDAGYRYLAVWPGDSPGDARAKAFSLQSWKLNTRFGLHVLDYQLPLGDLVSAVRARVP